jgi:putative mRNA 3-end processing factor
VTKTKTSSSNWLSVREEGLYIRPADIFIDPIRPVKSAIVTHGHSDHAKPGHGNVYATPETLAIMKCRYGNNFAEKSTETTLRRCVELPGGVVMTLLPAGHILGSAQITLVYRNEVATISGDFKRSPDPTCESFEVQKSDIFITEATFALPVFNHPPIEKELGRLLQSLEEFSDRCHLVGAYALGKCQRVMATLRNMGYKDTIYLHGAQVKLVELYEQLGVDLGVWRRVSELDDVRCLSGKIVLAPPSALADRWSQKLPNVMACMASGWMQIRARAKQKRAELPLVISDHADWTELLKTIEQVSPKQLWVTHGREEALVHKARQTGIDAMALNLLGYEDDAD